jgi:hypothetical protein
MIIPHPLFKDISLEAKFHEKEPPEMSSQDNLGYPGSPAYWEVTAVYWNDTNITDFVYDHCDFLLQEFAEDLIENP